MNLESTRQDAKVGKNQELFDEYGRLIPTPDRRVYSQVSRRYFVTPQPTLNLREIYGRIQKHLNTGDTLSFQDFEGRAERILQTLEKDEKTKSLMNAVRIPFFCTPETKGVDMGQELDEVYLKAVGRSFTEKFPEYKFTNYFEGKLTGQVSVVPNTRYERFIEARKRGPVVGWYFPNCLSEYAVPDQRELVSSLPDSFILSGSIDAAAALIGSPDLLMKKDDFYPHLLCQSAVAPTNPADEKFFYFFEAYGWNLTFNRRSYVGAVSEYFAGGLIVLG